METSGKVSYLGTSLYGYFMYACTSYFHTLCVPKTASLPVTWFAFSGCAVIVLLAFLYKMTSSQLPLGLHCSLPDVFAHMVKVVIRHCRVDPDGAWKRCKGTQDASGSQVHLRVVWWHHFLPVLTHMLSDLLNCLMIHLES